MKYSVNVSRCVHEEDVADFIAEFDKMFDKMIDSKIQYGVIQRMCDHFYWEIARGFDEGTMTDENPDDGLYAPNKTC